MEVFFFLVISYEILKEFIVKIIWPFNIPLPLKIAQDRLLPHIYLPIYMYIYIIFVYAFELRAYGYLGHNRGKDNGQKFCIGNYLFWFFWQIFLCKIFQTYMKIWIGSIKNTWAFTIHLVKSEHFVFFFSFVTFSEITAFETESYCCLY